MGEYRTSVFVCVDAGIADGAPETGGGSGSSNFASSRRVLPRQAEV